MHVKALRRSAIGLVATAGLVAATAAAQDFDKGKTPAQIFQSDCAICHNNASTLGKSMNESALASFLSAHYTENRDIAAIIAAYLASNRGGSPERRQPRHSPRKKQSHYPLDGMAAASAVTLP